MNHKQEAEKIRDKFRPHALLWDDHNDEPTKEDHVTMCAIIDVKHTIKQIERMYPHFNYGSELRKFQSILTELNKLK